MSPVEAFIRSFFESIWACVQFSLIMLFVSSLILALFGSIKKKTSSTDDNGNSSVKPMLILTLVQMIVLFIIVFPDKYASYTSPSYLKWTIAERYENDYPATWAYICKYSDDPYDYVVYYDEVWGDLQSYHGDGIAFDTLSSYEQAKVNYPEIGEYIYCVPGSSTYHSTMQCYALLRSSPSTRLSKYAYMFDPCSKCVGN